jgi:hypothetical protein
VADLLVDGGDDLSKQRSRAMSLAYCQDVDMSWQNNGTFTVAVPLLLLNARLAAVVLSCVGLHMQAIQTTAIIRGLLPQLSDG